MSTTSDPTPNDPIPTDGAGYSDAIPTPDPLEPTPVDPALDGRAVDPLAANLPPVDAADAPPRLSPGETSAAMRESDLKALYALAGFTEVALDAVRGTVTDTQRWASARLSELRFRREELARQADEVRRIAEGLPEDAKAVPEVAKGRVVELQEQASSAYSDLASRGQRVLAEVRSDVVNRIDPAFDKIQERIDAARQALRSRAASAPVPPVPPTSPAAPAEGSVEDLAPETVVVEEVLIADLTSEPLEPVEVDPTVDGTTDTDGQQHS